MNDMTHGSYLDEALARIGAVIDSPALVENRPSTRTGASGRWNTAITL